MCRVILNIIIFIVTYVIFLFNQFALSASKNRYFHDLNFNIRKEYYFFDWKKLDFKFLSEFSSDLFKNCNDLKYRLYIYGQHDLKDKNFLFFENSVFIGHACSYILKNIFSYGFGYNIFDGPIYFSRIKFSPSLYHVRSIYNKNCSKILVNNSWMYSYQLIDNIYYFQHLTILSNFQHVVIKLEHALSLSIRKDTFFLKCSYNVIINENKFYSLLPNINKYISVSLLYSL